MANVSDKYNYKKFSDKSPLIVFVHGAGCDYTFWSMLNRYYFFKGYSTLAINLPGHGDNKEKSYLLSRIWHHYIGKIVKKYSSKKNILVGHSMGSLICLSMVMNNLCNVEKTVLIGVALPMLVSTSLLNMSKKNSSDAISNMINWSLPAESKLRGSHLIGISLPNFINSLMSKNQNNLYFDLNACNKFIVNEYDLKRIENSFLIISGKLDKMTPLKSSSFLNSKLKNHIWK